jgi:tetratricopeptide (TPR) repeat protein
MKRKIIDRSANRSIQSIEKSVSTSAAGLGNADPSIRRNSARALIAMWDNSESRPLISEMIFKAESQIIVKLLKEIKSDVRAFINLFDLAQKGNSQALYKAATKSAYNSIGLLKISFTQPKKFVIDLDRSKLYSILKSLAYADKSGEIVATNAILDKKAVDELERLFDAVALSEYKEGIVYVNLGQWYDGLSLFEDSLHWNRTVGESGAHANTLYQLARTHHLIGNLDKARIHYRDAMRLYEDAHNMSGIAACKMALGHLMTQTGMIDEAIKELRSAKRIYRKLSNKEQSNKVNEVLELATKIKEKQDERNRSDL